MKKFSLLFAFLILCFGVSTAQVFAQVDTTNNNFTMIDATGNTFGGTNDVHFTWDCTMKTSVAASGQVSNATISSATPCPFFGFSWSAHDVAIYGPGTYTIYDGCPAGSPGCGMGNAVTFTVGANEIAAHMLFDWNVSHDIDVVDVWQPNAVFAPSTMWTGACGTGNAAQVWDWMSKDWDLDGINGAGMTDGPFAGSNANFNLMGKCPTPCAITSVTIRGGGQSPSNVDLQIQTTFMVQNPDVGCITDSSASTVTVLPGTILQYNCLAGNGPLPTSGTLNGVPIDVMTCMGLVQAGDKLIVTNKGDSGSDTDRMSIK